MLHNFPTPFVLSQSKDEIKAAKCFDKLSTNGFMFERMV
jgi:hypothetical protein